jgi:hypothetical protein
VGEAIHVVGQKKKLLYDGAKAGAESRGRAQLTVRAAAA